MATIASGYRPHPARIADVRHESHDTRTFVVAPGDEEPRFAAAPPGQFVMLSLLGFGEAAFTISGVAGTQIELTVRRVGSLTTALFALDRGDRVGLRGPFGRGFTSHPDEPTVYVAGGCGLSPLKRAIEQQLEQRPAKLPLAIVFGVRSAADRIHRAALAAWRQMPGVRLFECAEAATRGWQALPGSAVSYIAQAVAAVGARRAVIGAPPRMIWPACEELRAAGVAAAAIEVALERVMKCGTGECGHCYVDNKYVCRDGPVFTLAELEQLPESLGSVEGDPREAVRSG